MRLADCLTASRAIQDETGKRAGACRRMPPAGAALECPSSRYLTYLSVSRSSSLLTSAAPRSSVHVDLHKSSSTVTALLSRFDTADHYRGHFRHSDGPSRHRGSPPPPSSGGLWTLDAGGPRSALRRRPQSPHPKGQK